MSKETEILEVNHRIEMKECDAVIYQMSQRNVKQAQTILELQEENKKLLALIKYKQDQGLKWMQKKLLHAWPEVFSSFVVTALDQVQRGHIYINKQDAREAGIL